MEKKALLKVQQRSQLWNLFSSVSLWIESKQRGFRSFANSLKSVLERGDYPPFTVYGIKIGESNVLIIDKGKVPF